MKQDIQQILNNLYQIDSSLKNHEKDLKIIIQNIITARPDTKFDKSFAQKLRAQLMERADKIKAKKGSGLYDLIINTFTMKKYSYAVGGALIAIILAVGVFSFYSLNKSKSPLAVFSADVEINKLAANAFGSLLGISSEGLATANGSDSAAQPEITGRGGGGGYAPSSASESAKAMPPYYEFINYKYVYNGEPITLESQTLDVLKRIKGSSNAGNLSSLLQSFNLGLADLSGFSNSQVQNISFIQNKKYGYYINANLDEGSLTIYKNHLQWPQVRCSDQKCYEQQQLKIGDLPADEELIKIANNFLASVKISTQNYGQPFIDSNWRIFYEQAADKSSFYVPDTLIVVYPLQINGLAVYEGNGYPVGLNVAVDIKEKKVSSVNGLFTQNYQSSAYPATTDVARVMKWVEKGGIFSNNYATGSETLEVEVGNPSLGYFRKWVYKNETNDELLVPALIFPIINRPEFKEADSRVAPDINKKNVVVPLITEVLDEFEEGNDGGPVIEPLPLPAVDDGVRTEAVEIKEEPSN